MTYVETNGLHSAPDAMASEYETYDFLYGLVRMLKPQVIIETGTYKGGATLRMADALHQNGTGYIVSCDTDENMVAKARNAIDDSGLTGWACVRCCTGVNQISKYEDGPEQIDLAFLDSSGDRVAECAALNLSPKGVVVLHDSKRPEYRPIWTMRPWASIWEIDTPRGLTVFQS